MIQINDDTAEAADKICPPPLPFSTKFEPMNLVSYL